MSVRIEGDKLPTCPKCDKVLDGATHAGGEDDAVPTPGDISICLYCVAILQFQEDLSLNELSEEEILEFPSETFGQIAIAKASIELLREEGKIE